MLSPCSDDILTELRGRLEAAVKRNSVEGILLSGGLDTSILAFILASVSPRVKAFNVRLNGHGADIEYARTLSREIGLELHHKEIGVEEALETLPKVIEIRRSFDPALPNDLAIYFALKSAAEEGVKSVMTGDGADELFAGYDYMVNLDLEQYIPRLARRMEFSANEIGTYLGIEIRQPFLDREIIEFALSLKPDLKIKNSHGKWVLRKAYEDFLPREIVWQGKRPIENGSGFTKIRELIAQRISDEEFAVGKKKWPVRFLSKDHLFYYLLYKDVVGKIPKPDKGEEACPGCGTGIMKASFHCRVCGWCKEEL